MPEPDDAPSPRRAAQKYRDSSSAYDRRFGIRAVAPARARAVARLDLRPGDTVIDVACGTGLNFAAVVDRIGDRGRLIGLDLSPEMLSIARARVERAGWTQVELVESAIQDADLPAHADAALFSFTHDVLRTREAVDRVTGALRGGGRVAAVGPSTPPLWLAPLRPLLRRALLRYVTTTEGFDRPWSHLAERVQIERVERPLIYFGWIYVASGVARER